MSENQVLILLLAFVVVMRIPRIVERWKAPLLRGPEWFFNTEVGVDFMNGPGAAILRRYRWCLAIPWAIEIPICAAILANSGKHSYLLAVILCITLFTRLNYYAARSAAEKQAQRVAGRGLNAPPSAVALSLEPRSLRDYTNPWVEAAIVLALGGSVAWLAYLNTTTPHWPSFRGLAGMIVVSMYIQAGLLMLKRAFVRARVTAPIEGAGQYLAWRDSLRRLSTATCDCARIAGALLPVSIIVRSRIKPWGGSTAQLIMLFMTFGLAMLAAWYGWRQRLQYLEVARRTKPANFLLLPDVPNARLFCFRPSLPVLLLNSPMGYALNLASAPAKAAGLYFAGYAALWILLTH